MANNSNTGENKVILSQKNFEITENSNKKPKKKELQSIYLATNDPVDFADKYVKPKLDQNGNVHIYHSYIQNLGEKDIGFFVFNDLSYGLSTLMQSIYVAPQSSTLDKPIFAIHPSIKVQYNYLKEKLNNQLSDSSESITPEKAQTFINLALQSQITTQSAYKKLKSEITRIVNNLGHTRSKLNDSQDIITTGFSQDNVELNNNFNKFVEALRKEYIPRELTEENKKINSQLLSFSTESLIEPNTENFFLEISYLLLQCSFYLAIKNQVGVVATIHKLNQYADNVKKHGLFLNNIPLSKQTEYAEQRQELSNAYELLSTFIKEQSFGEEKYAEVSSIESAEFDETEYSTLVAKKKAYNEWTEKDKELGFTEENKTKYDELVKIDEELKRKEENLKVLLEKKTAFDEQKREYNEQKNKRNAEIKSLQDELEKEKLEFEKQKTEKEREINEQKEALQKELKEKQTLLEEKGREINEIQTLIENSTKKITNIESKNKNNITQNNSKLRNLEKQIQNIESTPLTEPTFEDSEQQAIEKLEQNILLNKNKLSGFEDLKARKNTYNSFHSTKAENWTNQNEKKLQNMQKKKTLINSGVKLNKQFSPNNLKGVLNTFRKSDSQNE